jgi:hypothetical protein
LTRKGFFQYQKGLLKKARNSEFFLYIAVRLRKRDNLLTREGGGESVGEEPNHTNAKKPDAL